MDDTKKNKITVTTRVQAPPEKVWVIWTSPEHIVRWNHASDDWYTSTAVNDLRPGGQFSYRMEARDGSMGFDFNGHYNEVVPHKLIDYSLDDGRRVKIIFSGETSETGIIETFEAENQHSLELQQAGWQSILNQFKNYTEKQGRLEWLSIDISIHSSAEKVFNTMIEPETYQEWTREFNPTSHFSGSWEKNSKILFKGTDQEGKTGGMVSRIRENIPYRFISIEHLGIIKDGKEIMEGPEVEVWKGCLENYTFRSIGNTTNLIVDIETVPDYRSYFKDTWPKALNKLRFLCEK